MFEDTRVTSFIGAERFTLSRLVLGMEGEELKLMPGLVDSSNVIVRGLVATL